MEDTPVEVNHKVQHRHPAGIGFCCLCGGKLRPRRVLPEKREYKVCVSCGYVDFLGPKLVAGCLVIKEGRILLLRRGIAPQMGKWTFPGGYVELGEIASQAAVRETCEEVGLNVQLGRMLGLYFDEAKPEAAVVVYFAEAESGAPARSHEATEVRYFTADEIPWDEIAFATTRAALSDWVASLGSAKP